MREREWEGVKRCWDCLGQKVVQTLRFWHNCNSKPTFRIWCAMKNHNVVLVWLFAALPEQQFQQHLVELSCITMTCFSKLFLKWVLKSHWSQNRYRMCQDRLIRCYFQMYSFRIHQSPTRGLLCKIHSQNGSMYSHSS